jgi:hypothetical protein
MIFKRARTIGVVALVVAAGGGWAVSGGAWAQGDLRGTVQHVDPGSRTLYFTDGRIMQLKPGATLEVDGRAIAIDDLAPGAHAVMTADALASPATESAAAATSRATLDAEGTVASVDPQTGLITFTDGRVVRATDTSYVWLPVPLASLQPGMNVVVSHARPAEATGAAPGGEVSVAAGAPAPVMVAAAGPVATPARAATTRSRRVGRADGEAPGSALPRFVFEAAVAPDQVHVLFPPQAP